MSSDSVFFKSSICFTKEWSGFDTVKPINVIIGRNNSGKSHLLGFVEALCQDDLRGRGLQCRYRCRLNEDALMGKFSPGSHSVAVGGDLWHEHGQLFVGAQVEWEVDVSGNVGAVEFAPDFAWETRAQSRAARELRERLLHAVLRDRRHPLSGKNFRGLMADRDIRPEAPSVDLVLRIDGAGASNVVRRFITTSNPALPRALVQEELLDALNVVFGDDGRFTEIQVQEHDDESSEGPRGHWEICLGQQGKGLVSLSRSGSGLKTVLLVLLNLLVIPEVAEKAKGEFAFGFEELENNLHPAILRRLFGYLEGYALSNDCPMFLTTHSSVALDFFGASANAQIVHVTHDGEAARTVTASDHFEKLSVVSALGARPSDLLQANGVVWLEGPSDRVYLNRWIELVTEGELREGRDYQCAFYGGSLLARDQFKPDEDADASLANLFQVNPNIVVVCDSDKSSPRARLKDRVRRIRAEVAATPKGHVWITGTREVENYLPGAVLAAALGNPLLPDPERWENFHPRKGAPRRSYLERGPKRKSVDKVDLAAACAPHMTKEAMAERFDWLAQMSQVVECIRDWGA